MGKSNSQGWKGESRRHSMARMGYKTVLPDGRRLHMGDFVAGGSIHGYNVNEIYDHFIIAMLWSSHDDNYKHEVHLEDNYDIGDIDAETKIAIKNHIESFIKENHEIIKELEISEEMIGHDLFMDTQGHGVGFWDRGYSSLGNKLSENASKYFNDSMYAYAGDDGKIYFEGVSD